MKDYYKVLNVSPSATSDEIKKSFRQLAKETHPDKNKGSPESEAKFKAILEAYDCLKNEEERKSYDLRRETEELRKKNEAEKKYSSADYKKKNEFSKTKYTFMQDDDLSDEIKKEKPSRRNKKFRTGFKFSWSNWDSNFDDSFDIFFSKKWDTFAPLSSKYKFRFRSFANVDDLTYNFSNSTNLDDLFQKFFDYAEKDMGFPKFPDISFGDSELYGDNMFFNDPDSFDYDRDGHSKRNNVCPYCYNEIDSDEFDKHVTVCKDLPETHYKPPEKPGPFGPAFQNRRKTIPTAKQNRWKSNYKSRDENGRNSKTFNSKANTSSNEIPCRRCGCLFLAASLTALPYCRNCIGRTGQSSFGEKSFKHATPRKTSSVF